METSLSQDSSTGFGFNSTFDDQEQAKDLTDKDDTLEAGDHEQLGAVGLGIPLRPLPREVVRVAEREEIALKMFEHTDSRFGLI